MRFIACLVCALILGFVADAAAGCPTSPVEEEGGMHWCYSAGKRGNVHLWKPETYDYKTAVTVIYVHGYDLGDDGCDGNSYLDCVWDAHGLAAQFSKSGLNALFIAIEGPINARRSVMWTSLASLLRSVRRGGHIVPPLPAAAIAHSAGIYTVVRFLGDKRLRYVASVDALYGRSARTLAVWYQTSTRRFLVLIGAAACHAQTFALAHELSCPIAIGVFGPFSEARCVAAIDPDIGHMDVVRDGLVLPAVIASISPLAAPKRRHLR
jgi:hypothetical protein